jgi:oligoribonuclease NrnB/cAMP/cGMP phosphodiesterase (DHH superfamily)
MLVPHAELHGINYGDPFPWDIISKDDIVYMVDFSLSPFEDMIRLNKMCSLIWIDHHISAIEAYIKSRETIAGDRSVKASGCVLTWKFCYPERILPRAVDLLGRYDIFDLAENVLEFEYAMRALDTNPGNQAFWTNLFQDNGTEIDDLINNGKIIKQYVDRTDAGLAVSAAYELEFEGVLALVINRGRTSSLLFDHHPDISKYKLLISYSYDGAKYNVSLYSAHPSIDVANLASKYGGGGHKAASGFSVTENIFTKAR